MANYSQPTSVVDPELVEGQRKKDGLLAHIERTKDVRNKYNQVFEKSLERVESLKSSLKSHSRKSFELTRNGSQSSFNMNNFDKMAEQSNSPHLAILQRKIELAQRPKSVLCKTDFTPERYAYNHRNNS